MKRYSQLDDSIVEFITDNGPATAQSIYQGLAPQFHRNLTVRKISKRLGICHSAGKVVFVKDTAYGHIYDIPRSDA